MSKEHVTGNCAFCHKLQELVYFNLGDVYICIDCFRQVEIDLDLFEKDLSNDLDTLIDDGPPYPWDYLDKNY